MRPSRLLFAAALLGLLAACGGDAPAEEGSTASGEVLEGTISDAMLPVDRVRSEAPLAPPERTAGSADAPAAAATDAVEGQPEEGAEVPIAVPSIAPAED